MATTGRPRDAAVDERVLAATRALLADRGYAGLRIDDVAAEAGVAKTTIYRRWPTLAHLAVAAVAGLHSEPQTEPTDDAVADLRALARALLADVTAAGDSLIAISLDLNRQADAELQRRYREAVVDPPRRLLIAALERARVAGGLRAELAPANVADLLVGAVVYRLVIRRKRVSPGDADTLLAAFLTPTTAERP